MLLSLYKQPYLRLIIISLLVGLLAACSSNKVNQPTELKSFEEKLQVERLWKRSIGDGDSGLKLEFSSFLFDGLVYSIDGEGYLSVLDPAKDEIRWDKELELNVSGGLGGDEKQLYFATFEGELIAVDRQTANEVWRAKLSTEAISAPVSNGNFVAVQTVDGKLFNFGAIDGLLRWRYDSIGPLLSLRGTPRPIMSQRYTLTSFANGELIAFDNQSGEIYWKAILATPVGRTELERLVDPDGQAVIDGDTLYTVAYQGKLAALDVITGAEKWAKSYSSFNSLAFGYGNLFVTTSDGEVLAINPNNGAEVWRNEDFKFRRLSAPFVYQQSLVFADLDGYLHFLAIDNGEQIARERPDRNGVMGDFLIFEDQLLVTTRAGHIVAYKLLTDD